MSGQTPLKRRVETIKIVGAYVLFGVAWIYGSDTAVGWLVHDQGVMVKIAVVKGTLFIFCTAALLYFLISRFIQQLVAAESKQIESLINYQIIFNATNEAIFIHDTHTGNILDVNDRMLEMFGYTRDEALKAEISQLSEESPRYSQALTSYKIRNTECGGPQVFEWTSRKKTGEIFWTEVSLRRVTMHDHDRIIAVVRDISERRKTEEKLRISEQRMRLFFERQIVGMAITSPEKGWVQVNDRLTQMLGFSREELFCRTWEELTHPEDITADVTQFNRVLSGEINEYSLEKRFFRKDGTVIFTDLSVGCVRNADGSVDFILALLADITERKRAESDLLAERQYLTDIIDFLPDATFIIDTDQRVVVWNRAAEAMTGVKRNDLLGKGDHAYAVPFYGERRPILIDLLNISEKERESSYSHINRAGNKVYAETFIQTLNEGQGAYLWGVAAPLYDRTGLRTGAVEVIKDITELKKSEKANIQLQEQLLQAQKIESIGRLAGGVAHDFNNMLGVILGHAELAQDQLGKTQPLFYNLEEIRKAAQRSADITRQLLAFARKQTIAPQVIDLNESVDGMLTMLRRLIGEDINLAWLPAKSLGLVNMDPSQLDQILANLFVNARDAIADTGKVTIETDNVAFDEAYCRVHAGFTPGEYVMLAVSDNGCGMDVETMAHLFEPFFTTKGIGRGTGLGLATIYGIVKQNKGFINVYSELGQGTTFKIYLPKHRGNAAPMPQEDTASSVMHGNEVILLVEDEPMILNMTVTMLQRHGYRVLPAATPGEAIRLAQEHDGDLDLLMTDVVMPDMNGRDLARNLLSLYPKLKRLFMSGYTANTIAHQGVLDEGVNFIQKPFSTTDLAAKIREVLDKNTN